MTIILFLVVLAVLIFVHELGHFLVAKKSGIRVDEFAVGFPPKIFSWTRGETKYVLNLIPFGGYVKIFGENPDDESISGSDSARSFVNAKKWKQVSVLIAGIAFNIIFAWLLISISFMFGSIVPVGDGVDNTYAKYVKDSQVVLTSVLPDSPAEKAGLAKGDRLISINSISGNELNSAKIQKLVSGDEDGKIAVSYKHAGEIKNIEIISENNLIGISMENIGIVKLNPALALWEGAKLTATNVRDVAVGLVMFIGQSIQGKGDFSQVSGPVGIVGMVGDAANFGFAFFLGFVAFISLNLAVINLVPFPALDGGRILFVIIEAITRRQIKPKVANAINSIGFLILITLMLVITYRDIMKLF
jgi:regulator of sigma E protease